MDHILKIKDIFFSKNYFNKIQVKYFNLFTLLGYTIRNFTFTNFLHPVLRNIDDLILRLPLINRLAFKIVFVLSEPIKRRANVS